MHQVDDVDQAIDNALAAQDQLEVFRLLFGRRIGHGHSGFYIEAAKCSSLSRKGTRVRQDTLNAMLGNSNDDSDDDNEESDESNN
ncbi:hypothetical protein HDU79_002652 [Rhizoclosmatium sp. JEL0117]|nr:hypothetical protein HDU79_002652 [Rhizoclosmatium sp. JEL0117]